MPSTSAAEGIVLHSKAGRSTRGPRQRRSSLAHVWSVLSPPGDMRCASPALKPPTLPAIDAGWMLRAPRHVTGKGVVEDAAAASVALTVAGHAISGRAEGGATTGVGGELRRTDQRLDVVVPAPGKDEGGEGCRNEAYQAILQPIQPNLC